MTGGQADLEIRLEVGSAMWTQLGSVNNTVVLLVQQGQALTYSACED